MSEELNVPISVGIIMDGNRRWAKERMLPSKAGHHAGSEAVRKVCKNAKELGIKYLTLYAFSTENWKREEDEIKEIMNLIRKFLDEAIDGAAREQSRIAFIGDRSRLDEDIRLKMKQVEKDTKDFKGLTVTLAINYGGRDEIARAVRRIMDMEIAKDDITPKVISNYLDTGIKEIPDPELIIRTSGELRTSNFLVWQAAYSEYYFTEKNWPDFDLDELKKAVESYSKRNRRFGGK